MHKTVTWHERRFELSKLKEILGVPEDETIDTIGPSTDDGLVWAVLSRTEPQEADE